MNFLKNWIPYQIKHQDNNWIINWLDLADRDIVEPFFDETISICRSRMLERSKFASQSSTDFLIEAAADTDSVMPTAFIFHVSRCGSTLLSQALTTHYNNIVIAEAPLFDEILRAQEQDSAIGLEEIEQIFKAAVTMMGQQRHRQKKQYYIKFDSWHLHFYTQLRKWFPNTPFYFLSRVPHEVIASHTKRRGIHAIPNYINPRLLRVDPDERHTYDFNFYTSAVLKGFYETMFNIVNKKNPLNRFFDYSWGMNQMVDDFYKTIAVEADLTLTKERLSYHSKFPEQRFSEEKSTISPEDYPDATQAYKKLLSMIQL